MTESVRHEPNLVSYAAYQIFGYVLPAFLLVFVFLLDHDLSAYVNGDHSLYISEFIQFLVQYENKFWGAIFILLLISLLSLYIIGHLIGSLSSLIIERFFVRQFLGYPSVNLLSTGEYPLRNSLNYTKPLDKLLVEKIKETANREFNLENSQIDIKEYFWLCNNYVHRKSKNASQRINQWVFLFGFYRNATMSIMFYIFLKYMGNWSINKPVVPFSNFISIVLIFITISLFWNYLKLFKRNAIDVYLFFYQLSSEGLRDQKSI
jgi:hypothetical protein